MQQLQWHEMKHTFLDCIVSQSFYSEALIWFNHVNNTDISLSNKQITLNDIPAIQQLTDYPNTQITLIR